MSTLGRYIARSREAGLFSVLQIVFSRLSGYLLLPLCIFRRLVHFVSPPPHFSSDRSRASLPDAQLIHVLWTCEELRVLRESLDDERPGSLHAARALDRARQFLSGESSLLGWGRAPYPPAWHTDVFRGVSWPVRFHKRIDILRHGVPCDVKVPWEASRLQCLPWLAQAWVATSSEGFLREFWQLLRDWVTKNPFGFGVNWTCSMEVAIRAINIAIAANLCGAALTPSESRFVRAVLKDHFDHIRFNLELSDVRGNHYFFNLLGLSIIAIVLFGPASKASRRYVREFVLETKGQFHPDGTHIEHASGYQRLVTEGLLLFFVTCDRHGVNLPASYKALLEQSAAFLRNLDPGTGRIPLLGDADSGNVVIFGSSAGNDARWLVEACMFALRSTHGPGCSPVHEDTAWLFPGRVSEVSRARLESSPAPEIDEYPGAGIYVLRHGSVHVVVRCGSSGLRGRGSHDHNDQLSLCLAVFGRPLVIDPGTSNYTADLDAHRRDLSTACHSTVTINGEEQSPILTGSVTCAVRCATARLIDIQQLSGPKIRWVGVIPKYGGKGEGTSHFREVVIGMPDRDTMEVSIADRVSSSSGGPLRCELTLPFEASWTVQHASAMSVRLRAGDLEAELCVDSSSAAIRLVDGWYSPEYGSVMAGKVAKISFVDEAEAHLTTRIVCRRTIARAVDDSKGAV